MFSFKRVSVMQPIKSMMNTSIFTNVAFRTRPFVHNDNVRKLLTQYKYDISSQMEEYKNNLFKSIKLMECDMRDSITRLDKCMSEANMEGVVFKCITHIELNAYHNMMKMENKSYDSIILMESRLNKTMKVFVHNLCKSIVETQ